MSAVRSTPAGAALGAAAIVAAASAAIVVSGRIPAFSANRGLLQLVVAIPLALLATAAALAYVRVLTRAQMLWAMLPVAALVLLGAGAFELGYRAWGWVLALDAVMFVPWVAGMMVGSALRGRRR